MKNKPIINEAQLQAWIRTQAPHHNALLMRNNSGVLVNHDTGRPVRFGVGNDSAQLNSVFKSSDLIGITQHTCDCGKVYGVFTALEVKTPGWKFNANNPVHVAQNNFLKEVRNRGGIAEFISSPHELTEILHSRTVKEMVHNLNKKLRKVIESKL